MSDCYFEITEMEVQNSGSYRVLSNSTTDVHIYIYNLYFKPMNPTDNLLAHTIRQHGDDQCEFVIPLASNTSYILVVRTLHPNVTGMFSVMVNGPSSAIFNQKSKYFEFSPSFIIEHS